MRTEAISLDQFQALQEPKPKPKKHKRLTVMRGGDLVNLLCWNYFWQRIEKGKVQYNLERRTNYATTQNS